MLANVVNSAGSNAFIFQLRGTDNDANMVTSQLTQSGTFAMTVTKSDGGVWILNPSVANTFTGQINANGGSLGLTSLGIGSAAGITTSNGAIFAYGGPLVTSTPLNMATNTNLVFSGSNAITFNANVTKVAGANDATISNSLDGGALLTINGNYTTTETSARTINMRGYGSTVWNGVLANGGATQAATSWNIALAPTAYLQLSGAANTYTGTTTLTDGILILDKSATPLGVGGPFAFNGGTLEATSNAGDLTTANGDAIANPLQLNNTPPKVAGSQSIEFSGPVTMAASRNLENEITGVGKSLILSNASISATVAATLTIYGAGNTLISGNVNTTGTGALSLQLSGTGALSLTNTNLTTGALIASRSTITLSGAAGGSWNAGTVTLNPTGTLTLDNSVGSGGNDASGRINGAISGNGGTLNIISNGTASTQSSGVLTLTSIDTSITMSGAGTNSLTFASLTEANTGSSLDLSTITSLGSSNKVLITAALPTNFQINNVMPRTFINAGANFATYNATNGVQAFTAYNLTNNLDTALATDTLDLTASAAITANRTINALKLDTGGVTVTGATEKLTLSAAAILNAVGNNTLSTNQVDVGANTAFIQVAPTTTLTINSGLTGSAGLSVGLGGTLTFGAGQRTFITSSYNLLNGTTNMSGGTDNFMPNQALSINAPATLDLNGSGQYVGALTSVGVLPGGGGLINGGGALVTNSSGTFAGTIDGLTTNFGKAGTGALTLESAQTYSGTTLLMGGTTTLEDDATLLNTSDISINGATLTLSNNTTLQTENTDRVGNGIPITLRSGIISVTGRLSTAATETFGAITAAQGANGITAATGGGTVTSLDLTFASLTRTTGATVNFAATGLGQLGNSPRITFTTPLTTVGGGALGAWAIANSTDYAAYNTGDGVGIVGTGGYVGYSAAFGSGNITDIPTTAPLVTTLPSGTTTTGMLKISDAFSNDIAFTTAGDTLNLQYGGILRSNNNNETSIGTTTIRGILTSGVPELVVFNNSNTSGAQAMTINSLIEGSGTTLVKSGGGVLALTGANTYTGGTFVDQGILELRGTNTGDVVIPFNATNGLTITNALVTEFLTAGTNPIGQGQIAAGNTVTLNEGSTLTLVGANSLAGVVFNNTGGTATPTVATGGLLTLTGATPISVTSSNPAFIATISGSIDVGSGAKTINTPAIQVGGVTVTNLVPTLIISAPILSPGASFTKSGNGLLQLSGQSTFTGGLDITGGGVVIGASSTPVGGGGGLISGPLGTGAVTVESGASLLGTGTASFQIGNDIAFAGTPTFDSTNLSNTAFTLTLEGNLTGAGLTGTPTIQIANPGMTVSLLGALPAMTSITKTGLGILIFNATKYTGNFNATALGNQNAISLLDDGDGTGSVQTLTLGSVVFDAGIVPNITVNRAGGTLPYTLAANKILAPSSISNLGLGLTLTNTNGYGLQSSDNVTFTGTPTISVSTASASNVTQGLYLEGLLGGTGFIKVGSGAVVLGDASNSFTGNININAGVVSVDSDAELGNAANLIQLNPGAATSGLTATFRATGSFILNHTLQLSNSNTGDTRVIEVTGGNTLTINSAFDLNGVATSAASLNKADAGILALGASNGTWAGVLTITQGAVQVNNAGALGASAAADNTVVSNSGAAVELQQGISIAEPLTITGTGLFTAGALEGIGTGTSTETGLITLPAAAAIGSDLNNTLSLTGGFATTATVGQTLTLAGAGSIIISGSTIGTGLATITKIGTGSALIGENSGYVGAVTVDRGLFTVGSGATGTLGATGLITVNQNGTFTVDNTVSPIARLGARPVTIAGGTFNYKANSASPFTETLGVLTFSSGASVLNMSNTGASATTLTFASLAAFGGGSTGNITGLSATDLLKFTTAPTLSPATTGILPHLTVNGTDFATYTAAGGIGTFTAYAAASNILSAGPTQTFKATGSTANSLTGNQTLNALTLSGSTGTANVGGLAGLNPTTLTLTSGGILDNSTGATTNLSVPVVQFGATGTTEAVLQIASGATLTVTSGFNTSGGLTKGLNGTLDFAAQQYVSGNTTVNGGTLQLENGATNTLLFNNGLVVNTGGTVDLNQGVQFIAGLSSQGAAASADIGGGIVTNSGTQATLVVNSNTTFGGAIQGTIYLDKTGTGGLTFTSAQSYTGNTLITGGTLTLVDGGTINTPAIGINYGSLTLTNTGLLDNADRVNSAPITMDGGNITFSGRVATNSSETLGTVSLVEGFNSVFNTNGGTGINSSILTLGSLTRPAGSAATVRFNSGATIGLIGSTPNILISGITLSHNIIGPWAIVDRDYASYDPTYGIGNLNNPGFPGYAGSGLNSSPLATDNVRFTTAGTTVLAANTTLGTLNFASQTTATVLNLNGNTLTSQTGGILFGQATDQIDFSITNGNLTSGVLNSPSDFYLTHASFGGTARTVTISAAITDNGTGAVRLILTSGQIEAVGADFMNINGVNTNSGGTIINSGNIVLGATSALGTGGLTVYQGTLTQTAGNSIPSSNALTMGGGSAVTLAAQTNTLAGITFNNNGGAAPTLTPTGTLTLTSGITVNTINAGGIATIATPGTVDLNGNNSFSINVGAVIVNGNDVAPWQAGLIINSVIQNGGIVKSGAGMLQLGGQSIFTGGLTINTGGLILGASSVTSGLHDVMTSSPLGLGMVTMAADTTMLVDPSPRPRPSQTTSPSSAIRPSTARKI